MFGVPSTRNARYGPIREIGNESFGTGYYGGQTGDTGYALNYAVPYDGAARDDNAGLSPAAYGQQVNEFTAAMKAVDPTIKVGAVLTTPRTSAFVSWNTIGDYIWSYADLNDDGVKQANEPYWNDEVLSHTDSSLGKVADKIDFVVAHWYPSPDSGADGIVHEPRLTIPVMINGTTNGPDSGSDAGLRDSIAAWRSDGNPNGLEIFVTEMDGYGGSNESADGLFAADAYAIGRAYGASLSMHCDLVAALDAIAAMMPKRQRVDEVLPSLPTSEPVAALGRAPHDPRTVVRELAKLVGPDAIYACDIGNHMLFAATELALERPDSFYVSIGLGGMGSGIGYGIGLTLAHGDARPVVSISGDGGMLMVGNELATCAKYKIPTLFVVFNDGHLNMVQHGLERVFGRSMSCVTPRVDFCAYARSLGVEAHRIDGPEDLRRVADWGRSEPLLLEVPVDPAFKAANPREDTINFPSKSPAAIPPPRASA